MEEAAVWAEFLRLSWLLALGCALGVWIAMLQAAYNVIFCGPSRFEMVSKAMGEFNSWQFLEAAVCALSVFLVTTEPKEEWIDLYVDAVLVCSGVTIVWTLTTFLWRQTFDGTSRLY